MEKFVRLDGLVVPLDRVNVDTDQIIPKQFLKSIKRTGFGPHLFDSWRYIGEERRPNPDFPLNLPRYSDASILLARENFGCGSSREHAAWAMLQFGIRVVIAPTFADIFYSNCLKNGLLPIVLSTDEIDRFFRETEASPGYRLKVDLEQQMVTNPLGKQFEFVIEPFHKNCLLKGLDEIGLTLEHTEEIKAFEAKRRAEQPWLFEG
ncbi:MAG: 3-isopropylmalate dehydratase small subunit [Burkholderiales bacterium]